MQKWEYYTFQVSMWSSIIDSVSIVWASRESTGEKKKTPINQYLQNLGDQGWELVAVERGRYFFKRPLELIAHT